MGCPPPPTCWSCPTQARMQTQTDTHALAHSVAHSLTRHTRDGESSNDGRCLLLENSLSTPVDGTESLLRVLCPNQHHNRLNCDGNCGSSYALHAPKMKNTPALDSTRQCPADTPSSGPGGPSALHQGISSTGPRRTESHTKPK